MTSSPPTRLLTAYFEPALLGKVRSWHATLFTDGRIEQLVEMRDDTPGNERQIVSRAFYANIDKGVIGSLQNAVSSRLFHQLGPRYETPHGLLYHRELNAASASEGRHRVATLGACALARSGSADMIIFMSIWNRMRSALPLVVEEPNEMTAQPRRLNLNLR